MTVLSLKAQWHASFIVILYATISPPSTLSRSNYCTWNTICQHVTPRCLSHRDCGINVALPTYFNSDKFVSCQSHLWALAVQFVQARLFHRIRGGWSTNYIPVIFLWHNIIAVKISFLLCSFLHRTWSAKSGLIHIIFLIPPMNTWLWMLLDVNRNLACMG